MIKNSKGGDGYKMGIQFFRLPKDVDYTLCIEIQITDYRLWHKSRISIDKATSKGLTIGNVVVKKLSHIYANLSDSIEFMYYHKVIVSLRKLRQTHHTSSMCELIGTLRYKNADVIKDAVAAWGLCRGRRVYGGKNKLRWRDSATRPLIDRKEK